jgi:hypothetical protein
MISSDPPAVLLSAAASNPNLKSAIIIHSSSYQFFVYLNTTENNFTLSGRHCYHDDPEELYATLKDSEEVTAFVRQFIPTWCHLSIIQYEEKDFNSTLEFHQTFKSINQAGNLGTTFTQSIDYLRSPHLHHN